MRGSEQELTLEDVHPVQAECLDLRAMAVMSIRERPQSLFSEREGEP